MKRGSFAHLRIVSLTLAFLLASLAGMSQTHEKYYLDGKVFLKFKDNVQLDIPVNPDKSVDLQHVPFVSALAGQFGINGMARPFDLNNDHKLLRTFEVTFDQFSRVEELITELAKHPDVEYVEKADLPYVDWSPNDSLYNYEFGYNNWNWHLDVINAEMAWDMNQGSSDIRVAIVDNAVWKDHPDLINKIVLSYDVTVAGNQNSNPPATGDPAEWSHGTHCAGLVGAETNNLIGVASIGNQVSLIGIKASNNNSPNGITHWQAGIQWAANNGADVISMSFGGPGYSQTSQNLINTINGMGVVMLASAGNDNVTSAHYPSAYNHVISTASTNEDDVKSDFSNYGTTIDICAPGGYGISGPNGLLSTTYDETTFGYYDAYFGTSMATPVAAGLAGLIRSVNPELTPEDVEEIMESTAVDIYGIPGNANYAGLLGAGRIDAYAAIANTPYEPTAEFTTPVTTILPGSSIEFQSLSTGVPSTYAWEFQGGTPTISTNPAPTVTYQNAGVYTVYLTVTNEFGTDTETKTGYITVTATPAPWIQFSASGDYICNKNSLVFTDESLYSPTAWTWSFEPSTVTFINGTSASAQNPEVQFDQPGVYSVTLTAENANGSASSTMTDMIFVEGLIMDFTEDFESGSSNSLVLGMNTRAKVAVDTRSAAPGSVNGLHFQGSPTTGGWSGGPMNTTPQQAWETNVQFHSWAGNCSIDATGIDGVGLTFDLRQTYSIGPKYSWFRVLVNGEQVADVYDVADFNPATNTDPFDTKTFDLDNYGNSLFSITFQASCYLSDKFFAEGDNVFLDNIAITNTTKVSENGLHSAGVLTYPNPVAGTLNFSAHGLGRNVEMKVMSIQGQTILASNLVGYLDGDTHRVDLTGLGAGIYILRLAGDQGIATKKFIVR